MRNPVYLRNLRGEREHPSGAPCESNRAIFEALEHLAECKRAAEAVQGLADKVLATKLAANATLNRALIALDLVIASESS